MIFPKTGVRFRDHALPHHAAARLARRSLALALLDHHVSIWYGG
jgi:hypothetical protein